MPVFGVSIPTQHKQWQYLAEIARAVEAAGWDYVLSPEGPAAHHTDSLAASLLFATATRRVRVGTSIAIIYLRNPYLIAAAGSNIQELSGGRFVLGLGASHPDINAPLGVQMKSPVGEMRQYVADVRRHMADKEPFPIWLAATRQAMAHLAGEVGDGVNIFGVPHNLLARTIATVRDGARKAGRTQRTLIAAYARIGLDDDLASARRAGRENVRFYCTLPAYQKLYTDAGYEEEVQNFRVALARNDREGMLRAISDRLLDDTLLLGPESRCRQTLERFTAAGVDVILFQPLPIEGESLPSLFRPLFQKFAVAPGKGR